MRFTFLAAVLAAFLATSAAPPAFAADRPVGPEAGQARTGNDEGPNYDDPDDESFVPFDAEPSEIYWGSAEIIRWMQWYERNVGPIGF